MIQSYPGETKLRYDLIVSQQQTTESEEASFVVKDPETGNFYRFREVEHFVLQQLDGSTPVDDIRQRAEERFGAPLPSDTPSRSQAVRNGSGAGGAHQQRRERQPLPAALAQLPRAVVLAAGEAEELHRLGTDTATRCARIALTPPSMPLNSPFDQVSFHICSQV